MTGNGKSWTLHTENLIKSVSVIYLLGLVHWKAVRQGKRNSKTRRLKAEFGNRTGSHTHGS